MDSSYKKRPGTSGISGQLYESKLISLILFRLLHDDNIEEFYLASNMDGIGNFDDVCLKVIMKEQKRPLIILLQVKHKEDDNAVVNYDFVQNLYDGMCKVREKFYSNEDRFFSGKFEDTDCLFILYTNAIFKKVKNINFNVVVEDKNEEERRNYLSHFPENIIKSILSSNCPSGVDFSDKDLQDMKQIILEKEMSTLAKHLVKFLNPETIRSVNIMQDHIILRYHVILAESVVDVSEVQSDESKHIDMHRRELTFRQSFLNTDDENLKMLRNKIYEQIVDTQLKKKNVFKQRKSAKPVTEQLTLFLSAPCAATLSPLIGSHVIYKKGELVLNPEMPDSDYQKLEQVSISPVTFKEAERIAILNILLSVKVTVPDTFGNIDVKLGGFLMTVERRLDYLTTVIENLCKRTKFIDPYKIVTIDESVDKSYLNLNGGLASAIGNLLVYDKATNYLKFTENPESLEKNAYNLFLKLNKKINLISYRFDVKAAVTFPKLVFDYTDEAELICKLAVVYHKQKNHIELGSTLKKEIEDYWMTHEPHHSSTKIESLLIHYHNEIQKWWMLTDTAKYITKSDNNIYQQAINSTLAEPQMSAIETSFNMNNMKYFGQSFSIFTKAISKEISTRTIIESEILTLTTIKVIQLLKDSYYAVLDLESILKLSEKDFAELDIEIRKTNKILIIVCKMTKHSRILHKRLNELALATEEKKVNVITKKEFSEIVQEYFLPAKVICDTEAI